MEINMIQSFIQTPADVQALIAVALTFVFSFLLLKLVDVPALKWLADYLGQYKVQIVTWLTGIVVSLIDGALLNVPLAWEPVAVIVFQLVVAVAAVFGVFGFLANRGVRGLK
jgi:uncharacterized protein YacL